MAAFERTWANGSHNTTIVDPETPPNDDDEHNDVEDAASGNKETLSSPTSTPTPPPPPPPPDGGFLAWLQVAGAFFLFFNSWGVINAFGVFEEYYETTLLAGRSSSTISWIGTMQGFLLFVVGIVAGPIFDKGHTKAMICFGTFMVVFGLMMTSLSKEYYQLFLAQGVTIGIGCSFLFLPSVATVATYFTTKRALATGIVAGGGSVGSVIYPIMFRKLLNRIGFAWATRVMGFLALGTLIFSAVVMKSRLPPAKQARAMTDFTAFKDPQFVVMCFIFFFVFTGLYFPFFYLPEFFLVSLKSTEDLSFYVIAILNAASFFGRVTPGIVADKIGSVNTAMPMAFSAAILEFAWIGIHNIPGAIVFVCLYGFVSGAMVSLAPTVMARISPNMAVVGTRMGMSFTFAGAGLLIGSPIAGTLIRTNHATGVLTFWRAQVFSATMLLIGSILFVILRLMKQTRAQGWKV